MNEHEAKLLNALAFALAEYQAAQWAHRANKRAAFDVWQKSLAKMSAAYQRVVSAENALATYRGYVRAKAG